MPTNIEMEKQVEERYLSSALLKRKLRERYAYLGLQESDFNVQTYPSEKVSTWLVPKGNRLSKLDIKYSLTTVARISIHTDGQQRVPAVRNTATSITRHDLFQLLCPVLLVCSYVLRISEQRMASFDLRDQLDYLSSEACLLPELFKNHPSATTLFRGAGSKGHQNIENVTLLYPQSVDGLPTEYGARAIFLTQKNTYAPLNVTADILEAIFKGHNVSTHFLNILSCFGHKSTREEEALCLPFYSHQSQDHLEYMYMLKYPEERDEKDSVPWSIRHSAIYHQIRLHDRRSFYIVVSPYPDTAGQRAVKSWIANSTVDHIQQACLEPNIRFLQSYLDNWRHFLRYYDQRVTELVLLMRCDGFTRSTSVTPDYAKDLNRYDFMLNPVGSILAATDRVLQDIGSLLSSTVPAPTLDWLTNRRSTLAALASYNQAIRSNCSSAYILLNGILEFHNQRIAQQQSERVLYLTKSSVDDSATVRVITAITLVYLSFSVVATMLAMPLFFLREEDHSLAVSPSFWIYVAVAAPLTGITIGYWRWSLHRKRQKREEEEKKFGEKMA